MKAALKNEISILQRLRSDHIVSCYDVMESSKNYYIVQELCENDLYSEMNKRREYPEDQAIDVLTQICEGFLVLVREGIVHRYY